eukprot:TRINITY_DN11519_c0_g1_i1.p1 TRINITY_DN11519_c0_g1~~TRINITY_DN11519_c0_g1_i1.p1  ORF type:complete len:849 (+),score=175.81 TRINITY_DN11519_c0_g1_i1:211-2757(+)
MEAGSAPGSSTEASTAPAITTKYTNGDGSSVRRRSSEEDVNNLLHLESAARASLSKESVGSNGSISSGSHAEDDDDDEEQAMAIMRMTYQNQDDDDAPTTTSPGSSSSTNNSSALSSSSLNQVAASRKEPTPHPQVSMSTADAKIASEHGLPLIGGPTIFELDFKTPANKLICHKCETEITKPDDFIDYPPLCGDFAYRYICATCTAQNPPPADEAQPKGDVADGTPLVDFTRYMKSWIDVAQVVLYNLYLGTDKKREYFRWIEDICAFIEQYWETLCPEKKRTANWQNAVHSVLTAQAKLFQNSEKEFGVYGYWKLRNLSLSLPKAKGAHRVTICSRKGNTTLVFFAPTTVRRGGGAERPKAAAHPAGGKKRQIADISASETKKVRKTVPKEKREVKEKERPPRRRAPPDGEKPKKEPKQLPLLPIPKIYYTGNREKYPGMCFAKENSAPQVDISEDMMTIRNKKGYRMARGSWGATFGAWYFELQINQEGAEPHFRLGWSTEKGDLQAPVGFDRFSYSYRDIEGKKFHCSRGYPYADSYGPGDVIGFFIFLTKKRVMADPEELARLCVEWVPKDNKNDEPPHRLVGSKIIFVKNGKPMGVAFSDIFEGCYYPAVSIYMGGSVTANFGPNFKYPVSIDQLGITEEDIENATDNPEEQFLLQQVKPCCDLAPGLLPVMSPPPGGEYPFSPPADLKSPPSSPRGGKRKLKSKKSKTKKGPMDSSSLVKTESTAMSSDAIEALSELDQLQEAANEGLMSPVSASSDTPSEADSTREVSMEDDVHSRSPMRDASPGLSSPPLRQAQPEQKVETITKTTSTTAEQIPHIKQEANSHSTNNVTNGESDDMDMS